MRAAMRAGTALLTIALIAPAAAGAAKPGRYRGGIDAGYGSLDRSFDGGASRRSGTFALGFKGGVMLTPRLMLGLDFKGWLLEAYDFHDPSKGESVSEALPLLRVYPFRAAGAFVEVGEGLGQYAINHPLGFGGTGWAGTAGVGWDLHPWGAWIIPAIHFGWGRFGDVENVITTIRGRRFGVIDATVGFGGAI